MEWHRVVRGFTGDEHAPQTPSKSTQHDLQLREPRQLLTFPVRMVMWITGDVALELRAGLVDGVEKPCYEGRHADHQSSVGAGYAKSGHERRHEERHKRPFQDIENPSRCP